MKTAYYLVAALTLAVAGAAFGADDTQGAAAAAPVAAAVATARTPQVNVPAVRALTRAEVRAQAVEARRNGTLVESEADMDVAQTKRHYAR
ncbi:DUF4148 domain-containing protein [Pseudoduganella chitinolytica]|uniref:DUF4148 domain-containing protein n=1 Tax=Pseudoduganella chitinolytica TaxID=34070 RepID=A0ABY8BIB1_9BURK|nr:DUF4148 domain-containing protein [Pseudoduganella chitinolytica]WEF35716.1 DUF4148 domain-containing protein [Pseudoduganella chitinolytica]